VIQKVYLSNANSRLEIKEMKEIQAQEEYERK
jgi:hypothetical protein